MFWKSGVSLLAGFAALMLCVSIAHADGNADARALLEQANAAYLAADSSSGDEKIALMRQVRTTLDRIVEEYPSSDLAVQIVLGEPVGLIDVAEVDAVLSSAPPSPGEYQPIRDPEAAKRAETAMELDFDQRREIQRRLTLIGFNTHGVDGDLGPRTRAAIGSWQSRHGWPKSGYLDAFQVDALVSESDAAYARWRAEGAGRSGGQSGGDRGNQRQRGRYVGADGCLREADGKLVPYYSFKCDVKGALHLH